MQSDEFIEALGRGLPPSERLILCGFVGDPDTAPLHAWRPRPWMPGDRVPFVSKANAYVTVSSFSRALDQTFRRRNETFAAGRALMVDDVGTKVDRAAVAHVPPSAIVETSPGNEQWWYFLGTPERDSGRFDGVIRAFISGRLLGNDPGMSGVTRVGRLPGHVNGKAKHNGWRCELRQLTDRRFTTDELLARFELKIMGRRERREKLTSTEAIERNRLFGAHYRFMRANAMLKKDQPDPSGWTEATCPWVDQHTNAADTGAAIREPDSDNEYYGAFRCHHGHCAGRGWGELTDWINDEAVARLDHTNRNAEDWNE
jgi:hypothetical protein